MEPAGCCMCLTETCRRFNLEFSLTYLIIYKVGNLSDEKLAALQKNESPFPNRRINRCGACYAGEMIKSLMFLLSDDDDDNALLLLWVQGRCHQ